MPRTIIQKKAQTPAGVILQKIEVSLKKAGVPYKQIRPNLPLLAIGIADGVTEGGKFTCLLHTENTGYELSICPPDVKVPKDDKEAFARTAEYVARANRLLKYGGFDINYETGAVTLKYYVCTGTSGIGAELFPHVLYYLSHEYMSFGGALLEAVVTGETEPGDAALDGAKIYDLLTHPWAAQKEQAE